MVDMTSPPNTARRPTDSPARLGLDPLTRELGLLFGCDSGVLLIGPFSGVAHTDAHIRLGRFPVPFADLVGGSGEEYCPLPDDGVPVRSVELGDFVSTVWGERLRLDDGEAVATFASGDLDGSPAVLRKRAPTGGEGWYVGTVPPQHVLDEIVDRCLRSAGVVGAIGRPPGEDPPLPDGVEAVRRGDVLFLLNVTGEERSVALAGVHQDLLTGTLFPGADAGGTVRLGPEGAVALVEVTLVDGVPVEVVA